MAAVAHGDVVIKAVAQLGPPRRRMLPRSGHCRSADYLSKVLQVMKINASNWLSVI
jgi:hypothetical protein